jgi:hypothetical protein
MAIELHAFTFICETHQQAFVVEVNREDDMVRFLEMYTVTSQKHGEVKTKINFEVMMKTIIDQVGGNIPDSHIMEVLDTLGDMVSNEKKQKIQQEIYERSEINEAEQLVIASDLLAGLSDEKLYDLLERLRKSK